MNQRPTRLASGLSFESLPMGRDALSVRRRVEAMERVMEGLFTIPGTHRKVGMDVVLDIIPFAGSTIAAAVGTWMVWEARNIGMSKLQMTRMFGNVGVDWALGMIPFVGAIPDFFFRSNTRNLRIIKKHLDKHYPSTTTLEG
jgi:hypothetical protein